MTTQARLSSISDFTALTAQLDELHTDQSPEDLSSILRTLFNEGELYNLYISFLAEDEKRAKVLLEVFDKALTAPEYDMEIFKKFRQLCGQVGLLPTSHIVPGNSVQTTEHPIASGAFGDVWEGIHNDKRVAIKALRVYKHDDVQKVAKVFCTEVVMWKWISHPNIVPFLGASEAPAPLSMVSEWMPNGNVRGYVGKTPDASRLQLLLDISRGLSFLHSLEIVHGNLKGDNILVDKSGCARLNDFGFNGIAGLNCIETSEAWLKGSPRWMAPELIKTDDEGKPDSSTSASDVFALGMVTFEIFTGQVPFPQFETSAMVMKAIIDGERPQRPPTGKRLGLSDEFWEIIQSSLAHEMTTRPPVETFVEFLEKATPDMVILRELTEFDASSEGDIQKLRNMFEHGNNTLFGVREDEALVVIEVFDRALNSSLDDSKLRSRCLHGLQRVSARCGLLPKSYWISHSRFTEPDDDFSASGRVSKTSQRSIDGQLVAVKTINPDCINDFDAFKHKLCTNSVIWKRLRHPNVTSFLGFDSNSPPFSLVYPWMSNGNLSDYLRNHPDVDRLGLSLDVARGLTYLHHYNVVHGNLTGRNVLVDSNGLACISDYGLEIVLCDEACTKPIQPNIRWIAPEVLVTKRRYVPPGEDGKTADIYSFGMVVFEILTGTTPFPTESDKEIVGRVTDGFRPEWPYSNPPQGFEDVLWRQIEACWRKEPKERPTASISLRTLVALGGRRARFGKHIRKFLHLPRQVTMEPVGRRESFEKPKSGIEIIDRREENVTVLEDRVAYLVSRPIPKGTTLRKVVITVVSKDQGWSTDEKDSDGTYRHSWTWFELSVGPSKDSEKWCAEVVVNLRARSDFKEHTVEIVDSELYEKVKSGDVLTIWALARYQGWENNVKEVTMRYVVDMTNPLQHLYDLDTSSPQFRKQLNNYLRGSEYRSAVPNVQGRDLAWLVEHLNGALAGTFDPANAIYQELLHELAEICATKGVLPRSCTLSTDSLLNVSLPPVSGYVCEGTLDDSKVHIKCVRMFPKGDQQNIKETFYRVAAVWKHLAHPKIVPFLGATIDPLRLVSDWILGGDLTEYIANHPYADRLDLLSDVAEGLHYLHCCNVIHGDLKGPNVLVDTAGCARITNFGLATVAQSLNSIHSLVEDEDSTRWIAPEILDGWGTYSKEADVFSFAMVIIEVFTGAVPFSDKSPSAAVLAIIGGERPPRPTNQALNDGLWALTQQCWDQEAQLRPQAPELLLYISKRGKAPVLPVFCAYLFLPCI